MSFLFWGFNVLTRTEVKERTHTHTYTPCPPLVRARLAGSPSQLALRRVCSKLLQSLCMCVSVCVHHSQPASHTHSLWGTPPTCLWAAAAAARGERHSPTQNVGREGGGLLASCRLNTRRRGEERLHSFHILKGWSQAKRQRDQRVKTQRGRNIWSKGQNWRSLYPHHDTRLRECA